MNKIGLIKKLAAATQVKEKQVSVVLEHLWIILSESLCEGESIRISGFGTLKTRYRAARLGHLPRGESKVVIPEGRVVTFCPGKKLRAGLLQPVEDEALRMPRK